MSAHVPAYASNTEPIHPDSLYPYAAFVRCSGMTKSRIRELRLQGLPLPTIEVGRRLFIPGAAGIAYIRQAAELTAGAKS